MAVGPGSLKCVIAWSEARSLLGPLEEALRSRVRPEDVRPLPGGAVLVYTDADTASVRDWLSECLLDGESALVVEFERWSGWGPGPDRDWLRDRGH